MARDRDVRLAIQAALQATGVFDAVVLTGLPETFGFGVSAQTVAAIEPESSKESDKWDAPPTGDLIIATAVKITFMARDEDPEVRDAAVELLFDTAANALNGQNFAGLTLQPLTKFVSWKWEKERPPERRITSRFTYTYLVPGWNAFDATT